MTVFSSLLYSSMCSIILQDQGYGTEKKKRQAPTPPSALAMEKTMKEATTAEKVDKEKAEVWFTCNN